MVHGVLLIDNILTFGSNFYAIRNPINQKQVFLMKKAHDIDPERNLKSNFDRLIRASKI